jgi:hypothetical protein
VCKSSATKAILRKGRHLPGAGLGSITSVTFAHCSGLGFTFVVKTSASAKAPWKLNAVSYNKAKGVTTGTITGIRATLAGPSCSATVGGTKATTTGTVVVTYTNKTHVLRVTGAGNLHVWHVSGCLGLIKNGNASSFTGSYLIKPATTITSP